MFSASVTVMTASVRTAGQGTSPLVEGAVLRISLQRSLLNDKPAHQGLNMTLAG